MSGFLPALLTRLRSLFSDPASHRVWALAANDGIIATAGILEGFAGAGADDATVALAGMAATVSGMFTAGGAKWAETASEREAQLAAIEEERQEIKRHPSVQFDNLLAHYEQKGLPSALAREVAAQLMKRSPLKAQLESEHGIVSVVSRADVVQESLGTAISYAVGASVPLLVSIMAPIQVEAWLLLAAVAASLILTSLLGAHAGRQDLSRTLLRTLVIAVGTVAASYLVGKFAF
jgi:vacuolar iron transporter family protein